MNCEILTACASAKDDDGKLTINGAFSRINAPSFPCKLPMVIVVRIRSSAAEDGEHSLHLSLSDLDDKLLGPPAEATFQTTTRENEEYTWTQAIIDIGDIRIPGRNDYSLILQIDGKTIAYTSLYVSVDAKR